MADPVGNKRLLIVGHFLERLECRSFLGQVFRSNLAGKYIEGNRQKLMIRAGD